jgi:hypothetical protein
MLKQFGEVVAEHLSQYQRLEGALRWPHQSLSNLSMVTILHHNLASRHNPATPRGFRGGNNHSIPLWMIFAASLRRRPLAVEDIVAFLAEHLCSLGRGFSSRIFWTCFMPEFEVSGLRHPPAVWSKRGLANGQRQQSRSNLMLIDWQIWPTSELPD